MANSASEDTPAPDTLFPGEALDLPRGGDVVVVVGEFNCQAGIEGLVVGVLVPGGE